MTRKPPHHSVLKRLAALRVAIIALILGCHLLTCKLSAQTDEVAPENFFKGQSKNQTPEPAQAETDQSTPFELPYSRVFRDADSPLLFKDMNLSPPVHATQIGQGTLRTSATLFDNRLAWPAINRGFRPEDAEIKIGNFYLDLRALSASVLYSDNGNHSPNHRESGEISIVRLDMAAMYDFGDRLHIGVAGGLIWLPNKDKFGVDGFGILDPVAQFEARPLAHAQLTYDILLDNWDIQALEDFEVELLPFGARLSYTLFDGQDFSDRDVLGRYVYGGRNIGGTTLEDRSTFRDLDSSLIEARNRVGVSAGRLLPTVTRMTVGFYHTDYMYYGVKDKFAALPNSRDEGIVSLVSERETLRFKPFITYRISRYNYETNWNHEVRAGFTGPVTENIDLLASMGWFERGDTGRSDYLTTVRVRHQISAIMSHQIEYMRELTDPNVSLDDSVSYRFTMLISDGLIGELYAIHSTYEDLQGLNSSSVENRGGVRFSYNYSPKTFFRIGATYARIRYENSTRPESEEWVARAEMFYKITPTFEAQIRYQYTDRYSQLYIDKYRENLAIFTLIKYF